VVAIHSIYALCAQPAKRWLTSERGGRIINLASGVMFVVFGVLMAITKR